MLNQLPPQQRQQALDALRQMQSQGAAQQSMATIREAEGSAVDNSMPENSVDEFDDQRVEPGSRLVINLTPKQDLPTETQQQMEDDPFLQSIVGSNVWVVDDAGVLSFQGLAFVPLLGLREADVIRRLEASPI